MGNANIKEYIEKIVNDGDSKEMRVLSHMLDETIYALKDYDYDMYCDYKTKLYEMAYGKKLNREMAEQWVSKMKPMAKWTFEDTTGVLKSKGLNIDPVDFYVVMNMMYSDYNHTFEDYINEDEILNFYVEMTKNFLRDEDSASDKLYNYWKNITKKDGE